MMTPTDPCQRFLAIQAALITQGDWSNQSAWMRFAALCTILTPLEPLEIAKHIRANADILYKKADWFSDLATPFRFIISAFLVADGLDAGEFADQLPRDHEVFRNCAIRHGGQFETMAIAILRHVDERKQLHRFRVERVGAIYNALKSYHWWLTGPDDLSTCACLATTEQAPEAIGYSIEQAYQGLRDFGHGPGNHALIAAGLLTLSPGSTVDALARWQGLFTAFEHTHTHPWHEDFDAIALLCQLPHSAERVVATHQRISESLRQADSSWSGQASFNIASMLTMVDLIRCDERGIRLHTAVDLQTMLQQLRIISAASLMVSLSAQSIANFDAVEWPAGSVWAPYGGMA